MESEAEGAVVLGSKLRQVKPVQDPITRQARHEGQEWSVFPGGAGPCRMSLPQSSPRKRGPEAQTQLSHFRRSKNCSTQSHKQRRQRITEQVSHEVLQGKDDADIQVIDLA